MFRGRHFVVERQVDPTIDNYGYDQVLRLWSSNQRWAAPHRVEARRASGVKLRHSITITTTQVSQSLSAVMTLNAMGQGKKYQWTEIM